MNILQINTEKTWRGGERQTLLTMKGLKLEGYSTSLLCLEGYPAARKARELSLSVIGVKNQLAAYRYLLTEGKRFDLLHAQTGRSQGLAVLSRPFHGRKIIYTRRVDFKPRGIAARLKYRYTDQVVAISGAIKNILSEFIPDREIPVIFSCIDSTKALKKPSQKALKLRQSLGSRKIIACAAALVPHKDPLTLVRAVARLKKNSARGFALLHFGQGELFEQVQKEIEKLNLGREYLLMGFEEDVESFFPIFDLFVMSSREEGLGSIVLEAFRYKVPVVSTSAGGLEELVEGRGLLCPAENHMCLARRMNQMLRSPDLFQDLVQNAYAYVHQEHSLEHMTKKYIDVYQKLLGDQNTVPFS